MCLLVTSLPAMLSSLWGQMGQAFLKGNSELQGFILLTSYRIKPSEFSKCLYFFISILSPSFDGETIEKISFITVLLAGDNVYNFFFSAVTSYNLIVCPKQLDSIQPSHSTHQIYTLHPYLATQTLADSELSSPNSAPDGPFALSTCSGHSFNYDFYLRISMKSYQSTVINSSGCHISSFRDHLTPNSSNILSQT